MKWPFVSRDRYEAAQAEVLRLTARVASLEEKLDARAMSVLQSTLRKHGYALVGEDISLPAEQPMMAAPWSNLDWRIYEKFEQDYMTTCGGTKDEAISEYRRRYGDQPPSKTLIV